MGKASSHAISPASRPWHRAFLLAALTTVAMPVAAQADSLPITPLGKKDMPPGTAAIIALDQALTYDSNPLKLVSGAKSLRGSETTATLSLKNYTTSNLYQLDSTVSQGLYSDADFNATNIHEKLYLARKNERFTTDIKALYDYDTTRTTEITSFGIRAPNVRNTKYSAAPNIAFQYSPLNTVGLRGSVLDSSFDNRAFIDYRLYAADPYFKHKFDPRNSGTLNFNMQKYETQTGVQTTTTTMGPRLGWIWEYDDNLTARFNAGAEKSSQERANSNRTHSQINYVYSGNFTYRAQQLITDFNVSRGQLPTGNGVSYLLTDVNLKEAYLLNDRISLRGSLGYRYATYITNPGVNLDREYNGSGGIAYRIYKNLDLTGNYQYVQQKLTSGNGQLNSQSLIMGVSFHPADKAL